MKRILLLVGASALLVAPLRAQTQSAQNQNDMTIPEFRQVLLDLGSYLDANKGTNVRSRFSALSEDALSKLYASVPNPQQLKSAVAALKQHDAAKEAVSSGGRAQVEPNAVAGSCPPDTIIDDSSGAVCTPAYPDPNNSAWENMVNPLITFGAFSPSDYSSVSSQGCGLTVESNLVQVVAALNGTVTAASLVCSALNADPVGGSVAAGVCDIPVAVIAVAGAVSQGLLADCFEQDADVNTAKIDAGFHNTVTIFNALGGVDTHLTNVDNQITSELSALDTHVSNVDNHVAGEFVTLDAHLVTLFNQLSNQVTQVSNQVTQGTALLGADLKQVMKLELTPDGLKAIKPAILTCTGTNCPNVLANCPAAGCSWNNVGPLP
jgi:hypothetical protein